MFVSKDFKKCDYVFRKHSYELSKCIPKRLPDKIYRIFSHANLKAVGYRTGLFVSLDTVVYVLITQLQCSTGMAFSFMYRKKYWIGLII